MANETKTDTELESVALRIYVERVSQRSSAFGVDQVAAACFREAEAFLRVRDKVRNKEFEPTRDTGTKLSEASAPNLSPLHPLNMVSQRFGDKNLKRVREINEWLNKNATPDINPDDLIERFDKAFRDLNWKVHNKPGETLAVINTARAVFPAYCGN